MSGVRLTIAMNQDLLIGELAQQVGVDTKTIRFYEESDVLPPPRRLSNGYRVYNDDDVSRLRFVRGARSLDLALDDISEVLDFRDRGEAPCRYVVGLLRNKIAEVDARIDELEQLRVELQALSAAADALPVDDIEMKACVCHLVRGREPTSGT